MRLAIILTVLMIVFTFPENSDAMTYYGIDDGYTYGAITTSGDPFDPWGSTAASLDIPLGSVVTVCGDVACEDVTVNDVGGGYGIEGLDVAKGVWLRIHGFS